MPRPPSIIDRLKEILKLDDRQAIQLEELIEDMVTAKLESHVMDYEHTSRDRY
jgi:hypothetical protein